jgi:tetratricopeptide (TPR) repeat protein
VTAAQTARVVRVEWALDERDAAVAALAAGDTETAGRRARAALDTLEAVGAAHAETTSVLSVLGDVRAALGDLVGARDLVTRAARLLPAAPPAEDPDQLRLWCQVHTHLSDLERHAGDLTAAEQRLRDVVTVAARLGDRDDTVISALNSLGVVYKYAARFTDARSAYTRALAMIETAVEPDPLALADLCHNLGGLDHAQGRPESGIVWAERGLGLREAALDADHPATAADVAALGALYHLAGRFDDASAAYHRALAIFEAHNGADHYEVGMTRANLAVLASDEGRYDDAVRYNEQAQVILERVLGPDHPEVGLTLHNLGVALHGRGRAAQAADVLTRAHAVLAATLPTDHPQLAATQAALASCGPRVRP